MDRNGYEPSILATTSGVCYLCGAYCETARHEIWGGTGERSLSKRYGLWVNICPACHREVHAEPKGEKAVTLRDDGKAAFLAAGHTSDEFIQKFVKGNVKWWEID